MSRLERLLVPAYVVAAIAAGLWHPGAGLIVLGAGFIYVGWRSEDPAR